MGRAATVKYLAGVDTLPPTEVVYGQTNNSTRPVLNREQSALHVVPTISGCAEYKCCTGPHQIGRVTST